MNREILLRVRSPEGQYRITSNARDTYGELLLQLSKKLDYKLKDIVVLSQDGKGLGLSEAKRLSDVAYFRDGAILNVQTRNPVKKQSHQGMDVETLKYFIDNIRQETVSSKCNHSAGGKCINCIDGSSPKKESTKTEDNKPKCSHGPNGKCLNCTQVDKKDKQAVMKMNCQHGPNSKCLHCMDSQFISDVAHISFDHYLQEKKLKCKGVHPHDVKCNNCLPPSKLRFQVDKTCKKHEPYPKAMCNKCLPPNVMVKSQQYRHVDYVQFMNVKQIQDFVRYWVNKKGMAQQRVGYLYGYYAEDPHYKGGIRVIVQAIYEPPQTGTFSDFEITNLPEKTNQVDIVANGLSLQRVGWIYTENSHDCFMSEKRVRQAARLQQQFKVPHSTGYDISNFITVILRSDEKNPGDVKPEVYMISDLGQALERADLFLESEKRKLMKVKTPKSNIDAYPGFILGGKNVTEFEPQFLLVKIGHGSSTNKFAILKQSQFPAIVRDHPTVKDLREYLKRHKNRPSHIKYGDFNLLLYLAEVMDVHTAMSIAEAVVNETKIEEAVDDLIQHKANL